MSTLRSPCPNPDRVEPRAADEDGFVVEWESEPPGLDRS